MDFSFSMPSPNDPTEKEEVKVEDNMLAELKQETDDKEIQPFGSQPYQGGDNNFMPSVEENKQALHRIESEQAAGYFGNRPENEIDFKNTGYE